MMVYTGDDTLYLLIQPDEYEELCGQSHTPLGTNRRREYAIVAIRTIMWVQVRVD